MSSELVDQFASFVFEKVLASSSQEKTLAILGSIKSQPAIITLERLHYETLLIEQSKDIGLVLDLQKIQLLGHNDIYSWFTGLSVQDLAKNPTNKINLIYPATAKHISKYQSQKVHMVTETPEMYQNIVKPYIGTMKGERIQWVKNILFHNAEADSVLYRQADKQSGFLLLPDMKWDGKSMESLYIVCIVNRQDISSLRDLNESHLEWLESLNNQIHEIVPNLFNGQIKSDELRVFIHYQPSYYHFHIHIVNANHDGLKNGISAGKAILLEEVVDNLRFLGPKGYLNKNITYALGENHDLWKLLNN